MTKKNYEGLHFGLLEVLCIGFFSNKKGGQKKTYVYCLCDCGQLKAIDIGALQSGNTRSCGCIRRMFPNGKGKGHGIKGRLARIRGGMQQRCYNPNNTAYNNYGGRGITICDEWLNNPLSFYTWATNSGYTDNLTIDRIDNDGPYSPENCRWVSQEDNCRNKRTNHLLTLNGKTITISGWSDELGIKKQTLRMRITKGWSDEKTLTTPVRIRKSQGILIEGIFHTISQAAKRVGINLKTVNSRLRSGESIEDALYTPVKKRKQRR